MGRHVFAVAAFALVLSAVGYADNKVTINKRFPIENQNGPTLSPPQIAQTNECATKVYVDSFVPHATIKVYLLDPPMPPKLIGGPVDSFFGFDAIPLTVTLKTNDELEATQTVNGVTSAYSQPMKVGAMPSSLHDPDVLLPFYACGQIVPVDGLVSGVQLEVQDETSSTTIGTDSIPNLYSSDGWDPPTVMPLEAPPKTTPAHEVRAKQSACTGVHSNFGPAKKIEDQPSGCHPPKVEPPIVGNDSVTLDDLYIGALLKTYDHVSLESTALAIASSGWVGLNHPVKASSDIRAEQTLCTGCGKSKPVPTTTTLPPIVLVNPICEGQPAAYVKNSTINATLVLLDGTTPIGYGGAAPGEVPLYLAPPATFKNGEHIQVAEYIGPIVTMSNMVDVGCKVYTRHDIAKLTSAQIASLKKGFEVMMQRSQINPNDPTGLAFQANIHSTMAGMNDCTMGDPSNPHWGQCQHYSDLFLPWHRLYLYYFERILRKASGDPNLTIPYWNYELSSELALPLPFRSPAVDCAGDPASHPGCNPLYVAGRPMNGGSKLLSSTTDDSKAMMDTMFEGITEFGGAPPPGSPPVACHFDSAQGDLENQPHDMVHNAVGIPYMCCPPIAANDPIFWEHHAEIDHLWKVWIAKGGGRADPTSDTAWMNTSFNFYDETGALVSRSVKDSLDTVTQLQYRYDDDPPVRQMARPVPREERAAQQPAPPPLEQLASSPQLEIALSNETIRVPLELSSNASAKIERLLQDKEVRHKIVLSIDVDHANQPTGVNYEIYVDFPPNQEPDYKSIYYAGGLGLFLNKGAGITKRYDLTQTVQALINKQTWDSKQLTITLVPRGLADGKTGKPLPLPAGIQATITRVSLLGQ